MKTSPMKVELALYRARTAARAGDLTEAARLLADLPSDSAPVLALKARVQAQQGNLTEADHYWSQLQELKPDDAEAAAARQLIERIRAGRSRTHPVFTPARLTIAAATLTCALVATTWLATEDPPSQTAADTQLQQERQRNQDLQERLASIDREQAAAATRQADALTKIAKELTIPGVQTQIRTSDVRILFDAGLFAANATTVNQPGTALLEEIGRRLATLNASTTVVGHSVPTPNAPTSGGTVIALNRARSAAEHLATGGNLPLTAFTMVTADQTEGPFPDAPRNRTVTLLVTPTEPPQ